MSARDDYPVVARRARCNQADPCSDCRQLIDALDEIDRLRTENEWDVLIGRWVRGRLQLGGLPGGDFGVGYRDAIHDAINACAPNKARAMLDWLDRGGLP